MMLMQFRNKPLISDYLVTFLIHNSAANVTALSINSKLTAKYSSWPEAGAGELVTDRYDVIWLIQ